MISILASVVSLIIAVMGVLFSKSGERNTLNTVGYVLLIFVLLSGGAAIYQAVTTSNEATAKASENENLRGLLKSANDSLDVLKGQLAAADQQIKAANAALASARGAAWWAQTQATLQKATAEHRDLRMLFRRNVYNLKDDERADLPGFIGPSPIEEHSVRKVTFKFYIQEVLDKQFVFEKRNSKVFFRVDDNEEIELSACPSGCPFRMKSTDWTSDVYAYWYSHAIKLPITDSGVRALTYIASSGSLGFIEVDHDGGWDPIAYARRMHSDFSMQFKAYKVRSPAEAIVRRRAAAKMGAPPCSEPIMAEVYLAPDSDENKKAKLYMAIKPLIYIACERTSL